MHGHSARSSAVIGAGLAVALSAACSAELPLSPTVASQLTTGPVQAVSTEACWGQATQVFASTGEMGEHASQQPVPRIGLRNLARSLADAGLLEDDSMRALGVFVSEALGLSIDACQR